MNDYILDKMCGIISEHVGEHYDFHLITNTGSRLYVYDKHHKNIFYLLYDFRKDNVYARFNDGDKYERYEYYCHLDTFLEWFDNAVYNLLNLSDKE